MRALLTDFRSTRPPFEVSQAQSLAWLEEAHVAAEVAREQFDERERAAFAARLSAALRRCACDEASIGRRASVSDEILSTDWDHHTLYDVRKHPHGQGAVHRTRRFAEAVDAYFEGAYADEREPPDDLIHVTCTGYVAPSGAQRLVARRGWGARTRVTHAYHMGCYAALPALRIAGGFLATGHPAHRVDLVHTELCSLHLDPADHRLDQLVVQSLFADGLIRYAASADDGRPGLRVVALHERVLPDSADAMRWHVSDFGMQMTLARDVPARIAGSIRAFLLELFARAELGIEHARGCVFAIHPGGPRIVDLVRDALELDEAQVDASRAVLFDHGNMSSATLPHIWMRLLADPAVPPGTRIPSLAFGPGLTMSGALLEKQ